MDQWFYHFCAGRLKVLLVELVRWRHSGLYVRESCFETYDEGVRFVVGRGLVSEAAERPLQLGQRFEHV